FLSCMDRPSEKPVTLGHTHTSQSQESTTSPGAPATSKQASPSVSELILWAVATSPKCQGLSLEALKKIITKAGYDVVRNKTHFLRVLKGLVSKGLLKQMTGMGTGALDSFTISKGVGKKKEKAQRDGSSRTGGQTQPGGTGPNGENEKPTSKVNKLQ
uniref:H15 domain-containing protein n=1 Tax=Chelonoidis abingdonii TaxID=106734 RepID=A0A8C0GDQ0_CHEAB